MQPISSPEINKVLRRYLAPILREHGFPKVEARKAWGWHGHTICVFEIRAVGAYFSAVTGWPPMSITASMGMYYDFISPEQGFQVAGDKHGRLLPREWECHLRDLVRPTLNQSKYQSRLENLPERKRNDIWWIQPNGENLLEAIENLSLCVVEQGLPWFERFSDLPAAFAEIEGERACYNKHRRAMYFARQLELGEKAKQYETLFDADSAKMRELTAQMQGRRKKKD